MGSDELDCRQVDCTTETLHKWVRQAGRNQVRREGLTSSDHEWLKVLEQEDRELERANEILRRATAFLAQQILGHRPAGGRA